MMKGIVKAAKIATKIVEVFHWVGTALMLAGNRMLACGASMGKVSCRH